MENDDQSNVIDLQTRQRLLPRQIRSAIKGQYVQSTEENHDPETFVQNLERRILSDLAYQGAQTLKKFLNESFVEGKDGKQ